jgi:cyclophilin family peptidyl-prolyl cis-trans isomerase
MNAPRLPLRTPALAATSFTLVVLGACAGGECPSVRPPELIDERRVLLQPDDPAFDVTAPDTFRVRFETTTGPFTVEVVRAWAPLGADRFYALVTNGFFEDIALFRVIAGFMAQFGLHGVPAVNDAWRDERLPDDPVVVSNVRGTLAYAKAGPDSRTTQLFINYGTNERLDADGFAPIARVVNGMDALLRVYSGYGETAPTGNGPALGCMQQGGNNYLRGEFERMDYIASARIVTE